MFHLIVTDSPTAGEFVARDGPAALVRRVTSGTAEECVRALLGLLTPEQLHALKPAIAERVTEHVYATQFTLGTTVPPWAVDGALQWDDEADPDEPTPLEPDEDDLDRWLRDLGR